MKKALGFTINDDYSFAMGVVLLSLKYNSNKIFSESDVIIYEKSVSEYNKELLRRIKNDITFIDMDENDFLPKEILDHPHVKTRWGKYVFQKYKSFGLLHKYDKVLFMDTDILILNDIDEMFANDYDITWIDSRRKITEVYNSNDNIEDFICGNGGIVVFNKSLLSYNLDNNAFIKAYNKVNNCRTSLDEALLICLAQDKKFKIKILPREYNNDIFTNIKNSKIIHYIGRDKMPWVNQASYLAIPEWKLFYDKWIKLGGTGPVKSDNNDFFNPDYVYKFLQNGLKFYEIINSLDVKYNNNLNIDFKINDKLYKQFLIKDLNNSIHYELQIRGYYFEFALHVEEQLFITAELLELFNKIKLEIQKKINNITLINKNNFLSISVLLKEQQINEVVNIFIQESLDKIKYFFNK